MFENKLSLAQSFKAFSILQVPIGIVGYFNMNSEFRLMYLVSALGFGVFVFILSFSKKIVKAKTAKKEEMTFAQKWDQIMGVILICTGLLPFIFLEQNIIISLSFIDIGIFSLIIPPTHGDKDGNS
ncbi:hypothetical protein [Lactobacillus sp. ESL0681]|uniref:hypothetical protein n=1 Tax=Lactobacillus sp. ESL0681 TaxID=2983211 RepID=UPI0023F834AB|nr:hypothetical protein [Lactobacillus sp. ESL0681]WEV40248.1 hypothetical protein OZX59_08740 [Lactobacillus sp. ESL0681]